MAVQFIFIFCMYPILLIMYYVYRNAPKEQNGCSFGVHIKKEWLLDPELTALSADYLKNLKHTMLILAVIPIVTFLIPYFSISFTIWMMWLLAVFVVPIIPYIRAYKAVLAIKKKKGWQQSGNCSPPPDIKKSEEVRKVKVIPFLAPIFLSVSAAVYTLYRFYGSGLSAVSFMVAVFGVLTLLFFLCALWMDRQKMEVISSRLEVNQEYDGARKSVWKNFWIFSAWFNTVFTVIAAASLTTDTAPSSVILWGSALLTLVLPVGCVWASVKIREIGQAYAGQMDIGAWEDDDNCWIFGVLYYNAADRHTIVSKRVGIGTTVNMATPVGKGLTLIGCLSILVIPICCIWLILEDFTPISLSVEGQVLVAEHLKAEYEIPVHEIAGITLIEEKPHWSKVSGTGLDHLSKGTFYIRNEGKCEAFLNPNNGIFLKFTAAGDTYYMSGFDDKETLKIYELILQEQIE